MSSQPERTEAANDLLTVTVSFVLYMTMLLVLVIVQGQETPEPAVEPTWGLRDLAALVMLVGGIAHLLGALFIARRRQFRLTLAAAEILGAGSLYLLTPGAWVWLVLAAGAFAAWAVTFQAAIMRFIEQPEEEPAETPKPPAEPLCTPGEAGEVSAAPPNDQES